MQILPDEQPSPADGRIEPPVFGSTGDQHSGDPLPPSPEGAASKPPGHGSVLGGRYILEHRLGRGRMGEIYQAVDRLLSEAVHRDHRVTIELFDRDGDRIPVGESLADAFVDVMQISHPNIAKTIDFGVDGRTSYFTTERPEGASLRALLEDDPTEPVTVDEVLAVVRCLADALQYLHGKGIVHGDLRLESVFVTRVLEVKVTDLASAVLAQIERSGEMRFGDPPTPDVSDDVFGLACIAYELLADELPDGGVSAREAVRKGLRPRRLKRLSRQEWKAMARALEPRPEKRTATVAEFVDQLGITGTETLREVESRKKTRRGRLLRPVLLLAAAVGVIAVVHENDTALRELPAVWSAHVRGFAAGVRDTALAGQAEQVVDAGPVDSAERVNPDAAQTFPLGAAAADVAVTGETETAAGPAIDATLEAPALSRPGRSPTPEPVRASAGAARDRNPSATSFGIEPAEPDRNPALERSEPGAGSRNNAVERVPDAGEVSSAQGEVTADAAPPGFAFVNDALSVSEGDGMVAVVIRRLGGIADEASVVVWTRDDTAMANDDYADLGVREERFAPGQRDRTVYVPLISDSLTEERERFSVHIRWDSLGTDPAPGLNVIVLDDD